MGWSGTLTLIAALAIIVRQLHCSTYCPYYSTDVIRMIAFKPEQLEKFKKLNDNYPNLHIKPWVAMLGTDTPGLYMAPTDVASYLVAQLRQWGMEASVLFKDVQRTFLDLPDPPMYNVSYKHAYVDPTRNRTPFPPGSPIQNFRLDQFHPFNEIMDYLAGLAKRFPKLCKLESIGKSYEGRDLAMLTIGTNSTSTHGLFLDATMHAREWLATSTAIYVASQLLTGYQNDTEIRSLVDNMTWYILPVVNADGYDYTWSTNRYWRRSRSKPDPCTGEECRCRGVDLNRNWDSHWNTSDACYHPCCSTFPGTKAFSEPETKQLAAKLSSLENRTQAYISLHSYSQVIMFSYGHTKYVVPDDVADLYEVAQLAANAVEKVNNRKYNYGAVPEILYAFSGGSQDWVKDNTKIKYSYLIELPPPYNDGYRLGHFCVDFSEIIPTGKEILEGVKVVAKVILGQISLTGKPWADKTHNDSIQSDTTASGKNSNSSSWILILAILTALFAWWRREV